MILLLVFSLTSHLVHVFTISAYLARVLVSAKSSVFLSLHFRCASCNRVFHPQLFDYSINNTSYAPRSPAVGSFDVDVTVQRPPPCHCPQMDSHALYVAQVHPRLRTLFIVASLGPMPSHARFVCHVPLSTSAIALSFSPLFFIYSSLFLTASSIHSSSLYL